MRLKLSPMSSTQQLARTARTARRLGAGGLTTRLCEFLFNRRFKLRKLWRLLLRYNLLALRGTIKRHHFAQRQLAKLTRRDVETQCTVANAANLFDVMSDLFEHLSDLTIAAFDQRKFIPGVVATANEFNLRRRSDDAVT